MRTATCPPIKPVESDQCWPVLGGLHVTSRQGPQTDSETWAMMRSMCYILTGRGLFMSLLPVLLSGEFVGLGRGEVFVDLTVKVIVLILMGQIYPCDLHSEARM